MSISTGLLCAFLAFLCWGFGDFFIQKATRTIGTYPSLFCIGALGAVALFPFVYADLSSLSGHDVLLLSLLGVVVVIAAVFDFEALKRGKIAVVEPVISLELPLTVALGMTFVGESVSFLQAVFMTIVFCGIFLAVTSHPHYTFSSRIFLERGAIVAAMGAIGLALVNFLIGVASRETLPLLTIWFSHTFAAVASFGVIMLQGGGRAFLADMRQHKRVVLSQAVLDNGGWIAYAFATTLIPIAVAITISEAYIALAVLLGIILNGEKLRMSQGVGVVISIGGVLALSWVSG